MEFRENRINVTSPAINFPFPVPPKTLEWIEAAPGVQWLRLPLPFRLDHVNIYLIEDGAGYTLIDTGIDTAACRDAWDALLAGPLRERPLTRILATHCHPDHIGLAGWLCERLGLPLLASQTEYLLALNIRLDPDGLNSEPYRSFYLAHGLGESNTDLLLKRGLGYLRLVSTLPRTFRRVIAGETLEIGGRAFEVLAAGGHAPEQVMLHCQAENLLLCADQVLAKITPNISVEAIDPDGDPLGIYLRSLETLKRTMPEDVLVLPGHNLPFTGLATRIDELVEHHATRCRAILKSCAEAPRSVFDLVPVVFGRVIEDPHQMSFAFSEALAHANFLARRGELRLSGAPGGLVLAAV
jgi:glyoxylase-like metal-dependent hydrolase (beta-lactamase superfamily II)